MTVRILWTGSRSEAYPLDGVRLAFDLVAKMVDVYCPGQPVVIIHGACPSGVDDMADREAKERGWLTDPHPADWKRCSPLCVGLKPSHRRTKFGGEYNYCSMAGFWRNKLMVETHQVTPIRLCVAQPFRSWAASPGTYDCYSRSVAAGIESIVLDQVGHIFQDQHQRAGRRK